MSVATISASQLAALSASKKPFDLIDVRMPTEYCEAHVVGARNVPLSDLDPAAVMQSRTTAKDEPLYVICQKGGRGKQACEKFIAAGFTNVVNVEGGTSACDAAGVPLVRGKKAISLERQVRIAAGSLVLAGVLLGRFVMPEFIWLAAFVGAGLVFAGVTDTCGMALLLARMPWNRVADGAACATR
jgi:rhodanese-related sulfurtransferase